VIKSQVFWDWYCAVGRGIPDGSKQPTAFEFRIEQAKKRGTYREVGGVRLNGNINIILFILKIYCIIIFSMTFVYVCMLPFMKGNHFLSLCNSDGN
jgi:hypothetical protein